MTVTPRWAIVAMAGAVGRSQPAPQSRTSLADFFKPGVVFQDRNGCAYFQVGLRFDIGLAGDQIEVAVHDRLVEAADASTALEVALWIKQLIQGSVDNSYRAAARTELTIGGRRFAARVLGAAASGDDLAFTLGFAPAPGA